MLPCGAGKTVVGIAAMQLLQTNTLVLTTNTVAVRQWIREVLARTTLGPDEVGEYTGEQKHVRPVTVATYQILTHRKGKLDEAKDVLMRAISMPSTPGTQVTILMHLAETQFKMDKKDEAKATLSRAKNLMQQSRSVTEGQQKAEMERLEKLINP